MPGTADVHLTTQAVLWLLALPPHTLVTFCAVPWAARSRRTGILSVLVTVALPAPSTRPVVNKHWLY